MQCSGKCCAPQPSQSHAKLEPNQPKAKLSQEAKTKTKAKPKPSQSQAKAKLNQSQAKPRQVVGLPPEEPFTINYKFLREGASTTREEKKKKENACQ